jgi:hypothetical protein
LCAVSALLLLATGAVAQARVSVYIDRIRK